jgi:hypothetical protein
MAGIFTRKHCWIFMFLQYSYKSAQFKSELRKSQNRLTVCHRVNSENLGPLAQQYWYCMLLPSSNINYSKNCIVNGLEMWHFHDRITQVFNNKKSYNSTYQRLIWGIWREGIYVYWKSAQQYMCDRIRRICQIWNKKHQLSMTTMQHYMA